MGSSVQPYVLPSVRRHNEIGSLSMQLLLQFLIDLFETLHVVLSWSEDVYLVWGLFSLFFQFFLFFQVRLLLK